MTASLIEEIMGTEEIKDLDQQENKSILQEAQEIVYERKQEKERQYGPFEESMEKTAVMASMMCDKEILATDVYKVLIALKLSRQSYNHKKDNLLDAVAYIAGLEKYLNEYEEE